MQTDPSLSPVLARSASTGVSIPVLQATGLRLERDGKKILDGVDLTIDQGETLALIGASGSGKTTLLRCLNRLVEPDAGQVRYEGTLTTGLSPMELRQRIGYVPQEGGLLPHWTVLRNAALVPRLLGWKQNRRDAAASQSLASVGLEPGTFAGRFPAQLSGGERQRVAIARALAAQPRVILFDEPFSAVDAVTRLRLQELFLELRRNSGVAALLITHDVAEAMRLGNRIGVVGEGRILQVGSARALRTAPAHPAVADLLSTAERLAAWSI